MAEEILVAPLDPAHIVVSTNSWGAYVSRDRGQTFSFVCAETWGGRSNTDRTIGMAIGAEGTLYVANHFEGLWMSRDGCTFSRVSEVSDACADGGCVVTDVVAAQGGGQIIALTSTGTGDGNIAFALVQTADAGTTWSPLGTPSVGNFGASSVAVSPANARRLWVAGTIIGEGGGCGGATTLARVSAPVRSRFRARHA
jgi:hypothetical protein